MLTIHRRPVVALVLSVCSVVALCGCAGGTRGSSVTLPRLGSIGHLVLIKLNDPGQASELIQDTYARFTAISSVHDLHCGMCFGADRPSAITDFDVAISMNFDDKAGYDAYLSSPQHKEALEKWKPRFASLRMVDITPAPR